MITVIHTLCLESLRFQPGQKIGNHYSGAINQSVDTRLVSSIDRCMKYLKYNIFSFSLFIFWILENVYDQLLLNVKGS